MAKVNFKRVFKAVGRTAKEHSPEILTGIGIAGFIATVVLAVKATPEVADSIEFAKENIAYDEYVNEWTLSHQDRKYDSMEPASFREFVDCEYSEGLYPVKLKFKDVFLGSWKAYLPAAITGCTSIACVIGGVSTSLRRTAAMATVAKVAETTLKEYSKKVVEEIGEEKEQKIKEKASAAAVEKVKVEDQKLPVHYGEQQLYCDNYTKRVFYATPAQIEKAFGELNVALASGDEYSMNDFHSCFGLDDSPTGEMFGWRPEDYKVGYSIGSSVSYDGRALLVICFDVWPDIIG